MLNLFSWLRLEIRFITALLTFALTTGLFLGQVYGEVWTDVSGMPIGNSPETTAMLQEVLKQIEAALDLLLAANTQDEFDAAVSRAMLPFFAMGENLQKIISEDFPAPNP